MKRVLFFAAGFVVVLAGAANVIVWLGGRGPTTREVGKVPAAEAALVLGAQVYSDGKPSIMLADRVHAAEALYRAGRVRKLLLSGDHSRVDYDEVGTMRRLMLADGIPGRDIFTDHAGFDTWDFVADRRDYGRVMDKLELREALARVKTVGDVVTGAGPKFLGPEIPITGDGRLSWGPPTRPDS
jgi:SanA protein